MPSSIEPAAIKHFLNTQDWSVADLNAVLDEAETFKRSKIGKQLEGRSISLLFFVPSRFWYSKMIPGGKYRSRKRFSFMA